MNGRKLRKGGMSKKRWMLCILLITRSQSLSKTLNTDQYTMSDYIPEDLISDILLQLPVISLLRCKSVCKSWFSLISSQAFVKSHLDKTGVDETLLICRENDNSVYPCHPYSLQCGPPLGLPGDLSSTGNCCRLVGSYNGVVCVSLIQAVKVNFNDSFYRDIYLWNPATKHSKLLPPHYTSQYYFIKSVIIGFGFDLIGNDFKVVRLVIYQDGFCSAELQVYSANRNDWRNVRPEVLPDSRVQCYEKFDICSNGFLFCKGWQQIIGFDLSQEVFNCAIKLPAEILYIHCITKLNDSIAVVRSFEDDGMHHKINLWTLDDDRCLGDGGVETSWTLVLSIDVGRPILYVLGYINTCDLILTGYDDKEALVWFSCNTEEKEVRDFPNSLELFQVIKYKESLFSIG